MKRALYLLSAVSLISAAPAMAGDMIYPGGTVLTEGVAGKPYWAVQANCAGVFGAASSFLADKGDEQGAADAKAIGVSFFKDAVDRVMKDRGVPRPAAIEALSAGVVKGRTDTLGILQTDGDGPASKWNYARSACLDVRDFYHAQ